MDVATRRELARQALRGYASGPGAPVRATASALARAAEARAVVLVEGVSDQIAVETLALRRGRELAAEGVVVVPMGGAHAITRHLALLGPGGADLRLSGLCDAAEEPIFRRAGADTGLRVCVCVEDLEDELIRALGTTRVEAVLESQGDLDSFRSLQRQPAWRDRDVVAQLRRYLGAGSTRKSRYARLLVETLELDAVPTPLDTVLTAVG